MKKPRDFEAFSPVLDSVDPASLATALGPARCWEGKKNQFILNDHEEISWVGHTLGSGIQPATVER